MGVGVESGVIPDIQLTASSVLGHEYGAQYSRLNSRSGEGAWCAGSCDPSEYLQIDLGQVYLIFEVSRSLEFEIRNIGVETEAKVKIYQIK